MKDIFTPHFVEMKKAVPIRTTEENIEIACLGYDQNLKDDLEYKLGRSIQLLPVNHLELTMYQEIFFHQEKSLSEDFSTLESFNTITKDLTQEENVSVKSEPIVKSVNKMIRYAVEKNISDSHVEAMKDKTRIRMRQSRRLFTYQLLPKKVHSAIIARIKILSSLDIAQKLLPQDGRMS